MDAPAAASMRRPSNQKLTRAGGADGAGSAGTVLDVDSPVVDI
jgi:hypothetical protein